MQDGARRFRIAGGEAAVSLDTFDPIDVSRETNGDVMLLVTLKMTDAPDQAALAMADVAGQVQRVAAAFPQSDAFVRYGLSLKCLRDKGVDMTRVATPFVLVTTGAADFAISDVRLGTDAQVVLPCS